MNAWLGKDTGAPAEHCRGCGWCVSLTPWCLSGDTLESDHRLSCFHHHLLAEIQIITCVLMWVVVLICSQSQWSMTEMLPLLTALLISSKMKRGVELIKAINSFRWLAKTNRKAVLIILYNLLMYWETMHYVSFPFHSSFLHWLLKIRRDFQPHRPLTGWLVTDLSDELRGWLIETNELVLLVKV